MKKKIIGLGVTAAVVAVLAVALVLIGRPEETPADSGYVMPDIIYVLEGASEVGVREVTAFNSNGGFTLRVEEIQNDNATRKEYTVVGYEGYPVSSSIGASVSDNASRLTAKSVVAESAPDLGVYGLASPSVTLDITLNDGSKAALLIGAQAPANEGYYVSNGSDTVFLVGSSTLNNFFNGSLDFMNKVISVGDPNLESYEVTPFVNVTLSGSLREEPIIIRPVGENVTGSFSSHIMHEPFRADVDITNGIPLIMTAFGLTADKVVGTEADKDSFGLDEPYSTIYVEPLEGLEMLPFTLSASRPDEDGNIYIATTATKLIYQIPASSAAWLEATVHDLMAKLALLPFIDSLSGITVDAVSKRYVFGLSGESDELIVTYEGGELQDVKNFRRFYQSLLYASFDAVADEPLPANPRLVLSYTYEYRDGRPADIVRFYEGPARRVFIVLNDTQPFYMPTNYIDHIKDVVEKVIIDETVISYI